MQSTQYSKKQVVRLIFNQEQQKEFENQFKISPFEAELNISGIQKIVFLIDDTAILFFKNQQAYKESKNEEKIYKHLSKLGSKKFPYLLKRIINKKLSPFPILVVKRLYGNTLYDNWKNLDRSGILNIYKELGNIVANYHEAYIKSPIKLKRYCSNYSKIDDYNWLSLVCNIKTTNRAFNYLSKQIKSSVNKHFPECAGKLLSKDLINKWKRATLPIAKLQKTLVHTDLHEGQILINKDEKDNSYKVSGIPDWGAATTDVILWDFFFNEECNYASKTIYPTIIKDIRKTMWTEYCKVRNIKIPFESFNLVFNLNYLIKIEKMISKEKIWHDFMKKTIEEVINFS